MNRAPFAVTHEFVDRIPAERKERTIYVSIPFATAAHNCMCGCGTKIITPLSPPQWKLTFDGETVSLWPSIGNSGLACGSHYVIERDRVVWADRWSEKQIARGRASDKAARDRHFGAPPVQAAPPPPPAKKRGWLQRLGDLFRD